MNSFIDKSSAGGDSFARDLTNSIKKCDAVVCIVSENSLQSQWSRREVEYAANHGKRIIPILVAPQLYEKYVGSWLVSIANCSEPIYWNSKGKEELVSLLGLSPKDDKDNNWRDFSVVAPYGCEPILKRIEPNQRECPDHGAPPCSPVPQDIESNRKVYPKGPRGRKIGIILGVIIGIIVVALLGFIIFYQPNDFRRTVPDARYGEVKSVEEYDWEEIPYDSNDTTVAAEIATEEIAADTPAAISVEEDTVITETPSEPLRENESYPTFRSHDRFEKENLPQSSESEKISDENSFGYEYVWWIILLILFIGSSAYWICRKRKIRIKLVANKDCTVEVDNQETTTLKAGIVGSISLLKGEYFITFRPADKKIREKSERVVVKNNNELVNIEFPKVKTEERKTIKCFIAGSTALKNERNALRAAIAETHNRWRDRNLEILSYTYEDFDRRFVEGGHQREYDEFITKEADLAVFIISGAVGEFTVSEFEKAMKSFKQGKHPQILVFNDLGSAIDEQSIKLRERVEAEHQYWTNYSSLEVLKLEFSNTLQWMVTVMYYS